MKVILKADVKGQGKKGDKLLAETSLNISEIAYRVGFSSASYFTKCYRDQFNRLPTDVHR